MAQSLIVPAPVLPDPVSHSQVRIDIDWERLLKRRHAVLTHSSMPPYLLRPEVHALLHFAKHANHHLLFSTLWRTGARISEALALTPGSFQINGIHDSYVSIHTAKQRGRPRQGKAITPPRLVPITDAGYLMELETYITTHHVKKNQRLFPINRQAAHKRLKRLITLAEQAGVKMSIPVSAHTFRHSFAVQCLLHRVDTGVLKGWMGHKDIKSTEVYLQLLTAETTHLMMGVKF